MSALNQILAALKIAGAAASYDLIEENVSGSTPSGWVDSGTPNWGYTVAVAEGTHAVFMGSGASSYKPFTGATTAHMCTRFRIPTALPGSTATYHAIRDSSGTALATFRVNASGQLIVFTNGAESTPTVSAMVADTWYYVWGTFVSGGLCTAAFSTDGTKPTSGNAFTSRTGGTGTAARLQLNSVAIYDRILASTTAIGSNP